MQIETLKIAAAGGDGAACFELAHWHAAREEFVDARRWLAVAAAAGCAQASNELGVLALHALDRANPEPLLALAHFDVAAAAGHAEARFHLALISLGGIARSFDAAQCASDLHAAAVGAHAPAQRALGLAWAQLGDEDAARASFGAAVALGDPVSAFLLARLSSDRDVARGLDGFAAANGIRRASAFVGGPSPMPSIAPAALPGAPDPRCFNTPKLPSRRHREQPTIETFEAVLSALECEYVIALASSSMQRSLVHDPATGGPMLHPMRTSSSMTFPFHDDELWLRQLQRRLAALTGLPLASAEPLAVLRYANGEEYRPHRDYLRDPAELAADAPGQRLRTIFAYLTDVESGGATDFPILGIRIEPRRGRVVMFDNVKADGSPDAETLHAGMPVVRGRKWLATLWLRERALRAW